MSYHVYGSGFIKFIPFTETEEKIQVDRLKKLLSFPADNISKRVKTENLESLLSLIIKDNFWIEIDSLSGSVKDGLSMDITFDGKYHDDSWSSFVNLVSPITDSGEIVFQGEDNAYFRLIFRNGEWNEDSGYICWDGSFNMQTCIFARAKENCKQLTCRNPSYTGPKAELNPHITFAKRLTEEPLQHRNDITYIMGLCEEAAAIITMLSEKCISAEHAMMLLAHGQCCSICATTDCPDRGKPCLCSSFQWDVSPGEERNPLSYGPDKVLNMKKGSENMTSQLYKKMFAEQESHLKQLSTLPTRKALEEYGRDYVLRENILIWLEKYDLEEHQAAALLDFETPLCTVLESLRLEEDQDYNWEDTVRTAFLNAIHKKARET